MEWHRTTATLLRSAFLSSAAQLRTVSETAESACHNKTAYVTNVQCTPDRPLGARWWCPVRAGVLVVAIDGSARGGARRKPNYVLRVFLLSARNSWSPRSVTVVGKNNTFRYRTGARAGWAPNSWWMSNSKNSFFVIKRKIRTSQTNLSSKSFRSKSNYIVRVCSTLV